MISTVERLFETMCLIRAFEDEAGKMLELGFARGSVHQYVGEEAIATAICDQLRDTDYISSYHRGHGHSIAKGLDIGAMAKELLGRAGGTCNGKGGSMHLIDESVGFMGSTAIVAGTIPVGVGLAYGMKCKRSEQLSCIFHGDAAVEAGVFFESVNFAVVKKLPVLFLCENNLYSVYSPLSVRQPEGRSIAMMAEGLGMKTGSGDGNDVAEIYAKTSEALASIRAGGGPQAGVGRGNRGHHPL